MNLGEIVDLITIRQYVVNATANPAIDRATVAAMNNTLLMVDKKILELIQSKEFRTYIDYKNVDAAIKEVANTNNIKSGLRRDPHTGRLEKIR